MMEGSSSNYYSILGVNCDSSLEEIRRSYRKLALRWHPDRWSRSPALLGEAKRKFQQIQEAYSVLSDEGKRMMYDAGVYDPDDDDEDEGLCDFVREMVSLVAQERKQNKQYSIEELQSMLMDLARDFESPFVASPSWCPYQRPSVEDARCSKRSRWATEACMVAEPVVSAGDKYVMGG